jgi:hypothetical protein
MSTNDKEDESKSTEIPKPKRDPFGRIAYTAEELEWYAEKSVELFIRDPDNFSNMECVLSKMGERHDCDFGDEMIIDRIEERQGIKRDKINGKVVVIILQAWWTYMMSLSGEDKRETAFRLLNIIKVDDVLNHYKLKGNIDNLKEEITIFELLEEAHIEYLRNLEVQRRTMYIPKLDDDYYSVDVMPLRERLRQERPLEYQKLLDEENLREHDKSRKAEEMDFWNS